jgi:hypothetical protein
MTAINAFAEPRRACLVTDSAVYSAADKLVTGFSTKVITLPHLNMAFATSGFAALTYDMASLFKPFASFEDAVAGIAAQVGEAWGDDTFTYSPDEAQNHFRLFIIGWSTARRCGELHSLSTQEEIGCPAFSLITRNGMMTPNIEAADVRRIMSTGGADQVEKLTRMIEIQRRNPFVPSAAAGEYAGEPRYVVGGCAFLTEITETGISQRVLKRWADRAGDYIDPSNDDAAVAMIARDGAEGMSKLRRDMLAKKAAKGKLRVAS